MIETVIESLLIGLVLACVVIGIETWWVKRRDKSEGNHD